MNRKTGSQNKAAARGGAAFSSVAAGASLSRKYISINTSQHIRTVYLGQYFSDHRPPPCEIKYLLHLAIINGQRFGHEAHFAICNTAYVSFVEGQWKRESRKSLKGKKRLGRHGCCCRSFVAPEGFSLVLFDL